MLTAALYLYFVLPRGGGEVEFIGGQRIRDDVRRLSVDVFRLMTRRRLLARQTTGIRSFFRLLTRSDPTRRRRRRLRSISGRPADVTGPDGTGLPHRARPGSVRHPRARLPLGDRCQPGRAR